MKVKFWTVQKLALVTEILQRGVYQPVFEYSDYAASIEGLDKLYDYLLESYNHVNGTNYPGLVFTFLEQGEDENIYDLQDYQAFEKYIFKHANEIKSMWNNLASKETIIMCVEKELDETNPLIIDINDFQYMMPPVMNFPPYSADYYDFLKRNMWDGVPVKSIFPSRAIQAHIPNIRAEEIVGLYPMFRV